MGLLASFASGWERARAGSAKDKDELELGELPPPQTKHETTPQPQRMHRGGAEGHGCITRVDLKVVRCTTRCPCCGTENEGIHFGYQLLPVCFNTRTYSAARQCCSCSSQCCSCISRISRMSCGVVSLASTPGDASATSGSTHYSFNLHGLVFCSATTQTDKGHPILCGLLGVPISKACCDG